jgi:hypothetical protein
MNANETSFADSQFTTQEKTVHSHFAAQALSKGGWDHISEAFFAMQRECSASGLRACNFRQFRKRVCSMRRYNIFLSPRLAPSNEIADLHDLPARATSISDLLRKYDNISIGGW